MTIIINPVIPPTESKKGKMYNLPLYISLVKYLYQEFPCTLFYCPHFQSNFIHVVEVVQLVS